MPTPPKNKFTDMSVLAYCEEYADLSYIDSTITKWRKKKAKDGKDFYAYVQMKLDQAHQHLEEWIRSLAAKPAKARRRTNYAPPRKVVVATEFLTAKRLLDERKQEERSVPVKVLENIYDGMKSVMIACEHIDGSEDIRVVFKIARRAFYQRNPLPDLRKALNEYFESVGRSARAFLKNAFLVLTMDEWKLQAVKEGKLSIRKCLRKVWSRTLMRFAQEIGLTEVANKIATEMLVKLKEAQAFMEAHGVEKFVEKYQV